MLGDVSSMENTLIVFVGILAVFLVSLLGIIAFFLFKLLKLKKEKSLSEKKTPEEITEVIRAVKELKPNRRENLSSQYCIDHPELYAKDFCAISYEPYCELCLTKERDIKISRKFLDLFLDSAWENSFIFNNEDKGADKLNELMGIKKRLWSESETPIIAQKQFKINIENDQVESYTFVKTRVSDHELIVKKLDFLNQQSE